MKRLLPLLLLLPLLFVNGCKKETDDQAPDIEFVSPDEGHQYNVYDSIHVYLRISDNMGLKRWKIKLVDQQLTPVLHVIEQEVGGKHSEIGFDYPIDNVRLSSGSYYLMVEVTDDNDNLRRVFRTLNITEIPQQLNGFFAVTLPAPSTLNVYKGDTAGTFTLFNQFSSDFTDLAVSSYWQQVYVNGSYFGLLRANTIDGTTSSWTQPSVVGASPYWGNLSVSGSKLWVSIPGQGQVRSYDQTGAMTLHVNSDNNFYPKHQFESNGKIFIEEKDIASSSRRIVVFTTSGAPVQETAMNLDVTEFFTKDADNIYAVGNDAGQGHLLLYNVSTNGFWEPVTLPAGLVTSAAQLDSNTVLIGMDNGNVYRFTYAPVGLLNWSSGINAARMRYDVVNDEIYTAEGSSVKVYRYNPFTLLRTIPFANTVEDLELWYNR